jgi:hypothetical protein
VAELEDQLAALAAARAEVVPPLDPDAARFRARRLARQRVAVMVAAAACVLALIVAGGVALFAGSGDSPSVRTPPAGSGVTAPPTTAAPSTAPPSTTAPPTTAAPPPPTCATLDGADASPHELPGSAASGQLENVQVEASDCTDEVSFYFGTAGLGASVSYRPGPLTLDPSGQPADVAGDAFLVVRFSAESSPAVVQDHYAGPQQIVPVAPSGVREVRLLQDFEGVMTWAIGLDAEVPFRIVSRDGAVAVQLATVSSLRATTCTNSAAHARFDVPAGWFVETAPGDFVCAAFAPEPFTIIPNTDGPFPWGTIGLSTTGTDPGPTNTIISTSPATVGGRAATVMEYEATGGGLFPAGYRTYEYVADWAPAGTLQLSVGGNPGPDFDARKAGLDAIAASVRYVG